MSRSILLLLTLTFALIAQSIAKVVQPSTIFSSEALKSCLINSFVPIENIFDQDSTPEQYNQLNSQWNIVGGKIYPIAYLVPNTTEEIQKGVLCSKSLNIRVLPKSGGHNFAKYTYGDNNTLIIDLRKLNSVTIQQHGDLNTAIIGAGTRFGKLGYELWVQGFTAQIGSCPSVGVSGYTLGGGKGAFARRQGLMSDNVIEMQLIDAEGRLLIVNEQMNPDLFFALRGAGGAQFGIVTQFIVKIYPTPYQVVTYNLRYPIQDFSQVYTAHQNFTTSLWNNTYARMFPTTTDILVNFNELRYEGEESEYEHLIQLFPPTNNITYHTSDYGHYIMEHGLETYNLNYIRPNINITQPSDLRFIDDGIGEYYYHVKSFQIPRELTINEIYILGNLTQQYLANTNIIYIPMGGKINEYNPNDNAYVHRNDLFTVMLQFEGNNLDNDWINNANTFFNATQTLFGHNGTYQNYIDPDFVDYLERYYGENLERLIDIKTKYDPENFFYTPQSIQPRKIGEPEAFNSGVFSTTTDTFGYRILSIVIIIKQLYALYFSI